MTSMTAVETVVRAGLYCLAAGVLIMVAACSKRSGDTGVSAVGDNQSGGATSVEASPPEPLHHLVELLKNPSFEDEVAGVARGWMPSPVNPQWKTEAGKDSGSGFVLKPPSGGRAQVEQVFALHPSVVGLTLQAQAEVRCVEPGAVVVEVEFTCGTGKKVVLRENTGSDQWQSVVLQTKLPAGANPANIKYRVAAYSNTKVAIIDNASVMMIKDEPALLDIELLANGSFERAVSDQVENWDVLPKTVGTLEQTEPATGKNLLKLAPRPVKAYSTLQQTLNLGTGAAGLKINAQVKVKGAEQKKAALMLVRKAGKEETVLASAENSGAEGWETLAVSADVPAAEPAAGEEPARILFRVALRPGATKPVMIDEASARLAK